MINKRSLAIVSIHSTISKMSRDVTIQQTNAKNVIARSAARSGSRTYQRSETPKNYLLCKKLTLHNLRYRFEQWPQRRPQKGCQFWALPRLNKFVPKRKHRNKPFIWPLTSVEPQIVKDAASAHLRMNQNFVRDIKTYSVTSIQSMPPKGKFLYFFTSYRHCNCISHLGQWQQLQTTALLCTIGHLYGTYTYWRMYH